MSISRKRKQNGNKDTIRNRQKQLKQKRIDIRAIHEQMQGEVDGIYDKYNKRYGDADILGEVQFAWYTTLVWLSEQIKLAGVMAGVPKYVYENLGQNTRREASKSFVAQASARKMNVPPELLENFKQIVEEQQDPKPPGVG